MALPKIGSLCSLGVRAHFSILLLCWHFPNEDVRADFFYLMEVLTPEYATCGKRQSMHCYGSFIIVGAGTADRVKRSKTIVEEGMGPDD